MHRCLNIVEVQRAIFREVYCQPKGAVTLARLARTCRAFNSTALDVLWATLDSFVHLIQTLPRDLWKIEPMGRRMTFQRPMSLRDWDIFFRYSSRVRFLFQSVGSEILTQCSSLSDDVIFALSTPPTYGPLIPYLRTLYWDKPNRKHASLLRLLLTPSLVSLSLSSCALRSPEVSILSSIGTVCPSLKSLSIVSHRPFANILDAKGEKILSEALLYLHSLESLVCPALDETAIIHLSHLPFLVELSFELQLDFQLEKVRPFVAAPAFASLQCFTLHASTLSTLTSLLEPMHFRPTSVSFVVASTPTPDALRLFFLTLVNACGSERLSRISLSTSNERQPGILPQQVSLSTFQSLFALPNINEFEFDAPCDIDFDDHAITTLIKHWPTLTVLSLNAKSGWGITSRVTPQGLITLLSRCAMLTDIALAVDFSEIDGPHMEIPDSRPGNGVTNDTCLVANFVTSAISFPVTVAAFLSDICPELEVVKSSWSHSMIGTDLDLEEVDIYRERWEEVENLLPAFSAVRRQCQEWAQKKIKEGGVNDALLGGSET
ncbi:hypothetical protein J3R82DRAFT_7199 [Butyriboletus roseoflavus]|nr:hypothetical protein J3R82DRAFT_7199 [Butyriboletus roseoflavus]